MSGELTRDWRFFFKKNPRCHGKEHNVRTLARVGRALLEPVPRGATGCGLRHHYLLPVRDSRDTSSSYGRYEMTISIDLRLPDYIDSSPSFFLFYTG